VAIAVRLIPQVYSVRQTSGGRTGIGINHNLNLRLLTTNHFTLAGGFILLDRLQIGAYILPGEIFSMTSGCGGFGQGETEFIIQKSSQFEGIFFLFSTLIIGQTILTGKKKQYEVIQAVELCF
jgi:hypothetical protein